MTENQSSAERGTPPSRLGEAEKQIHIAIEKLDDEALADDLQEALRLVKSARSEISDSDYDF